MASESVQNISFLWALYYGPVCSRDKGVLQRYFRSSASFDIQSLMLVP